MTIAQLEARVERLEQISRRRQLAAQWLNNQASDIDDSDDIDPEEVEATPSVAISLVPAAIPAPPKPPAPEPIQVPEPPLESDRDRRARLLRIAEEKSRRLFEFKNALFGVPQDPTF